ncbi:hypothetical protein CTI14_05440 [Methylobacterium radiotolerans]|nr:hypothetical protein CTI14_05440 [Methylobacterium radiotolerans]
MAGEFGLHRNGRACSDFSANLGLDRQRLLTPEAPDFLPVEVMPFLQEQGMNEPLAPPWMEQGQLTDALPKFIVLARFVLVIAGGFGQAHQETSPFGLDPCRDEFPRHGTLLGGRHRFF